jgi:hypothetical protein
MPRTARDVRRTRKVRSHEKVPDGEECQTKRIDAGDGTFRKEEVCKPKFRKEPVHDDFCTFTVREWKAQRTLRAQGGLADAPTWPAVPALKTGSCLGCERKGKQEEAYEVLYRPVKGGDDIACRHSPAKWKSIEEGSVFVATQSKLTGAIDCESLRPREGA